jgi:hypothetical protein
MTERGMTLDVAITASQARCPTCIQPSTHVHSHYRRTLADLLLYLLAGDVSLRASTLVTHPQFNDVIFAGLRMSNTIVPAPR